MLINMGLQNRIYVYNCFFFEPVWIPFNRWRSISTVLRYVAAHEHPELKGPFSRPKTF